MMTSADKVGGWVQKGQNHDEVILEWSQTDVCNKIINEKTNNFVWSAGFSDLPAINATVFKDFRATLQLPEKLECL